jgi:hypothetical protein
MYKIYLLGEQYVYTNEQKDTIGVQLSVERSRYAAAFSTPMFSP